MAATPASGKQIAAQLLVGAALAGIVYVSYTRDTSTTRARIRRVEEVRESLGHHGTDSNDRTPAQSLEEALRKEPTSGSYWGLTKQSVSEGRSQSR
jgi:hypothetical protein